MPFQVKGEAIVGYDVPVANFPFSLANIHSDYLTDQETSVTFALDNGNKLQLRFYDNARCVLTVDADKRTANIAQFKRHFPISIYSFPTLGPLEEEEPLLTDEYVRQSEGTRRAHRMFRNIWFRRLDQFESFQTLVEQTWEGMTISRPELEMAYPPRLAMFCKEGRVDRELCWAGFGFQVWLQILTHLNGAARDNVLVVDEPEIYLHPDLQRRLFSLLKASGKQLILATHSAEIINEAEHDEVVLIDRVKKAGNRVTDIDGLQEALFSIGSGQNIHLARLSRGKKILFLEGADYRLIRRLAVRFGLSNLADDVNITVVPIEGFGQRQRIEHTAWTFEKILKADISISAILDRDYRCREEVDEIVRGATGRVPNFHIWGAKEIENCLLVPNAIHSAVVERLRDRKRGDSEIAMATLTKIEEMIQSIAAGMKADVLGQYVSNRVRYFATRSGKDASTVVKEAIAKLDEDWQEPRRRLMVCPGKALLAALNTELHKHFRIGITTAQIIRFLRRDDVEPDLTVILEELDRFAASP
jgi:hypothetical protein